MHQYKRTLDKASLYKESFLPFFLSFFCFLYSMIKFRYNSPEFQIFSVGMICFCCPGMYNALSGLGAQGQSSTTAATEAGTALAVTFTLCSLIGAPV